MQGHFVRVCVFFFFFIIIIARLKRLLLVRVVGKRKQEKKGEGEQEIGRCVISHLKFFVLLHANNSRGGRHFFGLGFKS
jgi:hypothetical protein